MSANLLAAVIVLASGGCEVEPPDMRTVEADLHVPAVEAGPAAAGKRFREVLPEYGHTDVYHVTYLPSDWRADGKYPVIVEYAGNGGYKNQYGDVCTGRVEDSKLGYGMSAGEGFIWICLPYLNAAGTENVLTWWGDAPEHDPRPTIDYCRRAVPWICRQYGGDPRQVVLSGFSRGAIACNFIGLNDARIAKLWRAMVAYSHYDGVVDWGHPGADRAAARRRLQRFDGRPQFICAEGARGSQSVNAIKAYLGETNIQGDFTFRRTGFRNHNDAWILRPSETRQELRSWLRRVLDSD